MNVCTVWCNCENNRENCNECNKNEIEKCVDFSTKSCFPCAYTYTDIPTKECFQQQVYEDIPTKGWFHEMNENENENVNENKNENMNENEMFAADEYKRIMHNINNEGVYTDYIFEEVHDDYIVPNIFTQEEDDEIMKEFNESMWIPTPKQGGSRTECLMSDIAPVCIVKINYIGGIRLDRPLVCLLDTGSTGTMIQNRCLPPGSQPMISKEKKITTTINGTFDTSLSVNLSDISLPEFVNGRTVDGVEARLFDSETCRYDIIFGRDFLRKAKMKFCFKRNIVEWMGASITMKPVTHYNMLTEVEDMGFQPEDSLFISYINLILYQKKMHYSKMKTCYWNEITRK